MNSPDSIKKKWPLPVKLIGIVLVVVIPVVLVMLVFFPFVGKRGSASYSARFPLSENFSKQDIRDTIGRMRQDSEFAFYVISLPPRAMDEVADQLFDQLKNSRNKDLHFRQIGLADDEIKSMALLINSLAFPEKFHTQPSDFPALSNTMKSFLLAEFKLALMGLCYKSLYDKDFHFKWGQDPRLAAAKLQRIILELRESGHLQEWLDSF